VNQKFLTAEEWAKLPEADKWRVYLYAVFLLMRRRIKARLNGRPGR
jgi:hypothetical protein